MLTTYRNSAKIQRNPSDRSSARPGQASGTPPGLVALGPISAMHHPRQRDLGSAGKSTGYGSFSDMDQFLDKNWRLFNELDLSNGTGSSLEAATSQHSESLPVPAVERFRSLPIH